MGICLGDRERERERRYCKMLLCFGVVKVTRGVTRSMAINIITLLTRTNTLFEHYNSRITMREDIGTQLTERRRESYRHQANMGMPVG